MTGDAVLQYVVNAIVTATSIGAVTFAWRTNAEAVRIRTILCEPSIGLVDRVSNQDRRIEEIEHTVYSRQIIGQVRQPERRS